MKLVKFDQANLTIAEKQEEYETVHAYSPNVELSQKIEKDPEIKPEFDQTAPVLMCFELDEKDIEHIKKHGTIWATQLTFGQPMSPLNIQAATPEGMTEPKKEG